jgi:hypothetical protein
MLRDFHFLAALFLAGFGAELSIARSPAIHG